MSAISRQRLDKWLWFARLVKTRSQAGRMIEAGKVRINRTKTMKSASQVGADDVITVMINRKPKVVKILDPGKRRGPASEARLLYEDLTPPETPEKQRERRGEDAQTPPPIAPAPTRDPGTGRPTKRDRRRMERFQERSEIRKERRRSSRS